MDIYHLQLIYTYFLLFCFLLIVLLVVLVAFAVVGATNEFADRYSYSKTFVGSTFLAIATSFPELVNAITAGVRDGENGTFLTINSFYNISGANILQNVMIGASICLFAIYALSKDPKGLWVKLKGSRLVCRVLGRDQTVLEGEVDAESYRKDFYQYNKSIFAGKYILWSLIISETILLLSLIVFREPFKVFNVGSMNVFPVIFVIVWFFWLFYSYNQKKEPEVITFKLKKNAFASLGNKAFIFCVLCLWMLFAMLSYLNFLLVSEITTEFNIPLNLASGLMLSLITSLPEISSFYFLFKEKNYTIASSTFFGSSLFNLALPFVTSMFSGVWVFNNAHFEAYATHAIYWLMADVVINLFLFIATIRSDKELMVLPMLCGLLIVIVFFTTALLINTSVV